MTIGRPGAGPSLPLTILDGFHEGCQVISPDWTYLYLNDTAATQGRRSREDLLGRRMMDAYPGIETTPVFTVIRRCMEERTHEQLENEFVYPDGTRAWFDLRLVPVPEGVFILSLDVTQRKRDEARRRELEAQLEQSQRLETLGRLAGGVAHDFNNLLAIIIGHAEFGVAATPEHERGHAHLRQVLHAAESAAGLTRQLLAFSRRQVLSPRALDLNDVVIRLEAMVRPLIGDDVEFRTMLAPGLGKVQADPAQLDQVLLNLVVNARDAMPAGGKLVLCVEEVSLDASTASHAPALPPGRYALLSVTDTGLGMSPETLARVFEPFFTTKEPGRGTGLGMATAYGIVRQSGGDIRVDSAPGQGTAVRVYLPLDTSEEPAVETAPPDRPGDPGGETILIVEDQPRVREITALILEEEGYAVLTAAGGAEALALSEDLDGAIHLLLTDMVMPGMSGRELATRLTGKYPGLRVLYMSGYTDGIITRDAIREPGTAFIDKPFKAASLARKVREVLDA